MVDLEIAYVVALNLEIFGVIEVWGENGGFWGGGRLQDGYGGGGRGRWPWCQFSRKV